VPTSVAGRLHAVRARIDAATRAAGRPAGSVRLIAVSKTVPLDAIHDAFRAGQLGISAAVAMARLASRWRRDGQTLLDRFHALCREHGVWVSAQQNVPLAGALAGAAVTAALDRIVSSPPSMLAGRRVEGVTDHRVGGSTRPHWLPDAPLVELSLAGGRVLVRPSGTEPKLKVYVDLSADASAEEAVGTVEERLRVSARDAARELVTSLGALGEDTGRQGA
jgi:phosphomannomutase